MNVTCRCGQFTVQTTDSLKWASLRCHYCPLTTDERLFKLAVKVDEWGHEHLHLLAHRWLLGRLCDWRDRKLCSEGVKPKAPLKDYL